MAMLVCSSMICLLLCCFFLSSCSVCWCLKAATPSSSSRIRRLEPLITSIQECAISPTSSETFRIFHGRGGTYPGCDHITLDWFPPVWVLTSFQKDLSGKELEEIEAALSSQWHKATTTDNIISSYVPLTWVYQCRGLNNVTTRVMTGNIPDPHVVTEGDCQFLVQTTSDNNNKNNNKRHRGIFLDMAKGRQWLYKNAREKRVLNLFSYTCAFSLAALKGGATEVINMDKVQGTLKIGQRNHALNHVADKARFLNHDIWKSWGKLRKLGPYDIIVVDPPSYQKGSFVAKKDYGKLIRRLPDLLKQGGQVLLCLNAPELGTAFLKEQVSEYAPQLRLVKRLENPSTFPSVDPERALKVLLYELPAVVTSQVGYCHEEVER